MVEERNHLGKQRQEEKEKQLKEEFERIQKKLSEQITNGTELPTKSPRDTMRYQNK